MRAERFASPVETATPEWKRPPSSTAGCCRICCSLPQLVITFVFFYWPASQAVWQSFLREDAFGLVSEFVGLENYQALFAQPEYYKAMLTTAVFSTLVAALSLSIALLFATPGRQEPEGGRRPTRPCMIWPYAVAPAVAGVLWFFMFQPSLGMLARPLRGAGLRLESAARTATTP